MVIDRIGQKILRELTRDGRIANTQLAERVGLSPSACLRIRKTLGMKDKNMGLWLESSSAEGQAGARLAVSPSWWRSIWLCSGWSRRGQRS